jgi:hypothetical protein
VWGKRHFINVTNSDYSDSTIYTPFCNLNQLHGTDPFLRTRHSGNISRNRTIHYRFQTSPLPLVHILSQIKPVPTNPYYFSNTYFNIIVPLTFRPYQWSISLQHSKINPVYKFLVSSMRATCPSRYESLHDAVFSNVPSLHRSSVKIFSCSQTPSVCILHTCRLSVAVYSIYSQLPSV